MKWIARIIALPIALLVGAISWALFYVSFFGGLPLYPFSQLLLKLSPGMIVGAVLSYYVPGLFIWLLGWEFDGSIESVEIEGSSSEPTSSDSSSDSTHSSEDGTKNT